MHDATPKPVSDGRLRQYTQPYNIHLRSVSWQLKIPHSKGTNLLRLGRQRVDRVTCSINSVSVFFENVATGLGVTIDTYCKINKQMHYLVACEKQISALIRRCFISRDVNSSIVSYHFTHSSRLICCLRNCRSFHPSYSSSKLVWSCWSVSWLVLILSLSLLSGSLNQ